MPISDTKRDKTRRPECKRRRLTRKGQRIAKSARLFLAFAFPAEFASLGPTVGA